jgi:hypothetical protein
VLKEVDVNNDIYYIKVLEHLGVYIKKLSKKLFISNEGRPAMF